MGGRDQFSKKDTRYPKSRLEKMYVITYQENASENNITSHACEKGLHTKTTKINCW